MTTESYLAGIPLIVGKHKHCQCYLVATTVVSLNNNCTKPKLYQAYWSSFYGSEIWSENSNGLNACCTE